MRDGVIVKCRAVEQIREAAILVFIDTIEDDDEDLKKLDDQVLWFPLSQIECREKPTTEGWQALVFSCPRWLLVKKAAEF